MHSPVQIDSLARDDIELVARFFHDDLTQLGAPAPLPFLRHLLEGVLSDAGATCRCWVARDSAGGPALGSVLVNLVFSVKFAGRSVWIEELYVPPENRRRGIGRALVERVLSWAEGEGLRGIDLEAYQGNTPAAVLYRSLGFRRLGRERFSLLLDDAAS